MSFYTLITEGKLELETTTISREIINQIKNNLGFLEQKGYLLLVYGNVELPGTYPTVNLRLPEGYPNIQVWIQDDKLDHVTGAFVPGRNLVKINVHLSVAAWPSNADKLLPELKQTIRHELEHTTQEDEKLKQAVFPEMKWHSPSMIMKYYTAPAEVEAFVSGIYKQAKTMKKPVSQVMDSYLAKIAWAMYARDYAEEMIDPIIDLIREKWLNYLQKRFPAGK